MSFTSEQTELLKAPLNTAHVGKRKQGKKKENNQWVDNYVDYIEGWHSIAEANRIFGFDGWSREVVSERCVVEKERKIGEGQYQKDGWQVSYVMRVRVTVLGVVKEGTGAGHGIDADPGQAHESAIKEAETDAMKRALSLFGNQFGLALYDKARANVTSDPLPDPEAEAKATFMTMTKGLIDSEKTEASLNELYAKNKDEFNARLKPDELKTVLGWFKARKAAITQPQHFDEVA